MNRAAAETAAGCPLCAQDGGYVIHRNDEWRVVLVDDADYPGFCRVIWNAHMREMTDLQPAQRERLMAVVWQVEAALRETMRPDKINLACLGNLTPHLHWHVIPRHADDRHFPDAVWAASRRSGELFGLAQRAARLGELRQAIQRRLAQLV